MFSNTAYESFYTYIGLHLHGAIIDVITSQKFFLGLLVLIFGVGFFLTAWRFFSRYAPSVLITPRGAPLSVIFKLSACLFLGMMLLKAETTTKVTDFTGRSWHDNPYIEHRLPDTGETAKVSFVFDLLARSAEELARFATVVIDRLFQTTNPETEAPSYFYRAIMFAGSQTIDDPELARLVSHYSGECFSKVVPLVAEYRDKGVVDLFFGTSGDVDQALRQISLADGRSTCLDLKRDVSQKLQRFAYAKAERMPDRAYGFDRMVGGETLTNYIASQALVNHYASRDEDSFGLGLKRGAMIPGGTTASIFQVLDRIRSWDGFLSVIGFSDKHGAAASASRAQEFSELLQRAPHLKGMVRMLLMVIFPLLVFFVVAGRWRVLVYWFTVYLSVLLWTPLWTLFYHIATSVALSTETMTAFGGLANDVSLYGAELITSRLYHFYEVYAWLQLLIGPLPTAILAWQISPLLRNVKEEGAPEIVSDAKNIAGKVVAAT